MRARVLGHWALIAGASATIALSGTALPRAASRGQPSDEELARRRLDTGRAFARQANYGEALRDFQAVVDSFPNTSVADDALLEIGRYYLEVANEPERAAPVAETIIKRYSLTDSAPDAHIMAGRVALARSRQSADLDAALAEFERVPRLFPDALAVPRALAFAGETLRLRRRPDEALERFQRVTAEFPTSAASAAAHLGAGMVLAARGDVVTAMEELQRVRNRWLESREATVALARISTLYRLFVRARSGPPYAASDTGGPARIEGVRSMVATPRDAIYYATESAVSALGRDAERPPVAARPRTLARDAAGNVIVVEGAYIRAVTGTPVSFVVPRANEQPQPLDKILALVTASNGDWLVADEDERVIHRFDRAGRHLGPFTQARVSRLAINEFDEVAGVDREQKGIAVFDAAGRALGRIPARAPGYDMQDLEDVGFDVFGFVYVLERNGIYVFDPRRLPRGAPPPPARGTAPAPAGAASPLIAFLNEPDRSPSAIRRATAFAIDSAGRVYVADDGLKKIRVFQ